MAVRERSDPANTDEFLADFKSRLVPMNEIFQLTPTELKVGTYNYDAASVSFYNDRTNPNAGTNPIVTLLPVIPHQSLVHQQLLRMLHQQLGTQPIEQVQLLIMNEAIKRPTHEEAIQFVQNITSNPDELRNAATILMQLRSGGGMRRTSRSKSKRKSKSRKSRR
jgi:hypothetical protein